MAQQPRARELIGLSWKAGLVGVVAGLGAIAFRALIALFHNLAFVGRLRRNTTQTCTPAQAL